MNVPVGPPPPESASAGEAELPWPDAPESTGDPGVDDVLTNLGGLPALPVSEHDAVYGRVHDDLFAELDSDAGSAG